MYSRLQQFRASFLLTLSASLIYWIVSFWLPLPDYLSAIASSKYDDYRIEIQIMVASYLIFMALNLVLALLIHINFSKQLKFWLVLSPAAYLLVLPFILNIPINIKFSDQNYFVVFQALYRLFRFTRPDTFALALILTLLAVGVNVYAALLLRKSQDVEKLPVKLRNRYLIYTGVVVAIASIAVATTSVQAMQRNLDRQSCYKYRDLPVPQVDDEIPTFLNSVTLFGQEAGTAGAAKAFADFASFSRQYNAMLNDDTVDDATLNQYQVYVASAKAQLTYVCSEFSTD